MADPLGFFLLLLIGIFAVALGALGLWRGQFVGVFGWNRQANPALFWCGVLLQILLGAVCVALAAAKAFE